MSSNIPQFTVAEISRSLKRIIEDNFGYIKIKGEISGFKKANSGHLYFNLKDEEALINAVCFKQMADLINFSVEDGLEVIASGKITTYQGRSNYQIIVENLEISGIGTILAAIEERRKKLLNEGYFDAIHKKKLPFLPNKIGIITSTKGAVIEDIENRINARFPRNLLIYPASMQGKNTVLEVISGIKYFNSTENKPDVIIIARGGGSVEDLLPFNDENLVKEIFRSKIPIISAIGHETDTSLIDYVADVRAPTPSAAAEIVVPVYLDIKNLVNNLSVRLNNYFINFLNQKFNHLQNLSSNLKHPKNNLLDLEKRYQQLFSSLKNSFNHILVAKEQYLKSISARITPWSQYNNYQQNLEYLLQSLKIHSKNLLKDKNGKIDFLSKILTSYDYKNVLKRGYALVRTENKIIKSTKKVRNNQIINIEVSDGNFSAAIFNKNNKTNSKNTSNQLTLFDF